MTVPVDSTETILTESQLEDQQDEETSGIKFKDWGFKIDRLFEVAYRFYKRNESKAFHPSFDERNQLNALILQARYGNYDDGKSPDIGVLDLVGKNRRHCWSLLKGMSKMEAKSEFICTLDKICPFFKAYAEAVKLSSDAQLTMKLDENGRVRSDSEIKRLDGSESKEQLNAIRNSLQKQTYNQFKIYAEKQYPDDLPKQKYLITTLQEQYYQQYIAQMHPELNTSNNETSILSPQSSPSPATSKSNQSPQPITESATYITIDDPVQSNNHSDSPSVDKANYESLNIDLPENERKEELFGTSETSLKLSPDTNIGEDLKASQEPFDDKNTEPVNRVSYEEAQNVHNDVHKIVWDATPVTNFEPTQVIDEVYTHDNNNLLIEAHQPDFDEIAIGTFESYPEPKPIHNQSTDLALYPTSNSSTSLPTNSSSTYYEQQNPELSTSHYHNHQYLIQAANSIPQAKVSSPGPSTTQTEIRQNIQSIDSAPVSSSQDTSNLSVQQIVQSQEPWPCESSSGTSSPLQQSVTYESLESATLWTKKGVHEFKDSLIDDKHGGAYVVKQGILLIIQVPTYPDGKYIYWEFATEDYDIGFGLDFVYDNNLPNPLALNIYEESDDDNDEDAEEEEYKNDLDVESQPVLSSSEVANNLQSRERKQAEKILRIANTVSIVPTYRRESHEEVFVGRHRYPGRGYYLLKFDNTYSVLRSKSLFFRICYFI